MPSLGPELDVVYINLKEEAESNKETCTENLSFAGRVSNHILNILSTSVGPLATWAALKMLGQGATALKRLVEENRFFIIKTERELAQYENANGNAWVLNEKSLRKRQYYIRHPKIVKRNLLIEAKDFYDYIEEEQKDELIDFIMSHCSPKVIQIDRTEVVEVGGKAKANIKNVEVEGSANYRQAQGNYYCWSNPNGIHPVEPREDYLWIEKSIMRSICALSEGATLTQTYERDFTFGLSAGEAKTVGLDMSKHKKYAYTIRIEC